MALQVWLPLTKDLRNQGLASLFSSGTPVFKNNGKLGSKSLDLKTQVSFNCSAMANKTIFSIAFWAKVNADSSLTSNWVDVIGFTDVSTSGTNGQLRWETCYGSTSYRGSTYNQAWNISSHDNATYATAQMSSNPIQEDKGKWHHYVFTTNGVQAIEYRDGIVYANYTGNGGHLNGSFWCGQTNAINGEIQDVRIYDHCLSLMEVKELSKGLVLHYPLNRGGWGQENLLLNTSTPATWSKTLNDSGYAVNDCFKTQSPVPTLFSVDELITISFDWSTTATGGNFHVECGAVTPWIWGTVISSKGTRNSASNYIDITSSNKSGHAEITFKITSNQTGAADTLQWLRIRQDGADTASKTFTISKAKLERGSTATPWCPNSSDTFATTIDSNGTIEYDTSGYCNNGTRIGFSQQNLLLGSDFSSQYTSNLVTNSSTDWTKYLRGYNTSTSFTFSNGECTTTLNAAANLGVCFARKATDINLNHNSYYTLSCEAKSTQTTKPLCIGLSYYNNSNTWIWRGGTNPTNFTTANTWQKFSLTFKPDADTQYISYCFTVVGAANGTDTFTIRHCKLEKGSSMTPWVNRESNNWSSDTPKYQVSTSLNNNASKLHISGLSTSGFGNSYSIAWWGKTNSFSGLMQWGFSDGIRLNGIFNGNLWNTGDSANNPLYVPGTTTQVSVPTTNEWHHFVMVGDGSTSKVYKDGELWGQAKTYKAISGTSIYFNGWDSSTSYSNNNGYSMSDFRIYATALSASDVKSLYQNSAYIDSSGNVYGAVHSEV